MSDMTPTDQQLADEIMEWIVALEGNGLSITDDDELRKVLKQSNFQTVRDLFSQHSHLVVYVDGGLVQSIHSDDPDISVDVYDHDNAEEEGDDEFDDRYDQAITGMTEVY